MGRGHREGTGDDRRAAKLTKANRQLRSEVRQLRKLLANAERELEIIRDLVDSDVVEFAKAERRRRILAKTEPECEACGHVGLAVFRQGFMDLLMCPVCGHKKKVPRLEE